MISLLGLCKCLTQIVGLREEMAKVGGKMAYLAGTRFRVTTVCITVKGYYLPCLDPGLPVFNIL